MNHLNPRDNYRLICTLFVILFSLNLCSCAKPPIQEIVDAQTALAAARKSGAPELSPEEYANAEDAIAKAIEYMNDKKYDMAKENAIESKALAEKAIINAESLTAKRKEEEEKMRKEEIEAEREEERKRLEREKEIEEAKPEKAVKVQVPSLTKEGRLLTSDKRYIPDEKLILKRVYFDYDKYNLKENAKTTLEANAHWLARYPEVKIQLEGHCDERGTKEYNLALGERRARAAEDFLVNLGIDPSRISIISFGEEVPLDPRSNEEAWARNRRVQFIVMPEE